MTDNGTWMEENILASDLWAAGKNMDPMTPEEEVEAWRKTVGVLDSLCGAADSLLLEPLILALADALGRAREELERAEDRISRPEGVQLTEREKGRMTALMRRSDALGNAVDALEREDAVYPGAVSGYLRVLREEKQLAHEAFALYREEVGIPGPARKDARKPA